MATTTRATPRACINREHPVVTRHGSRSPHAATSSLRRMPPDTPVTRISANGLDIGRGQIPIPASPGEKSHSPGSRRFPRRDGFAVTATEQNPLKSQARFPFSSLSGFITFATSIVSAFSTFLRREFDETFIDHTGSNEINPFLPAT